MFISPWVQCPQVQKNIGIRSVSRRHIKKRTLPHGHNFLLFRYIPIGGNHSPCQNARQQPQCPWVCLDKSWATHGPSWSQQMIPISTLVLGYALNCRENLTFQTLGFGILVFGNNGAQCACKDNFQNEVVFLQVAFSRKWSRTPPLFSSNMAIMQLFSANVSFNIFQSISTCAPKTVSNIPWIPMVKRHGIPKNIPRLGLRVQTVDLPQRTSRTWCCLDLMFFWINPIRKYEGTTNATAYIWNNTLFFVLLDCWFGDVKKRWLVHQKSVTSLFICKINVDVVLSQYRISVTILASEAWKQAFALSIGHESERHSAGMDGIGFFWAI